jgi:two-component system nitrogen regulation sensor histidine kinase NtrY
MVASFRVQCVTRVLLIVGSVFVLLFLLMQTSFYFTATLAGALVIGQVLALIRFVEKTNRDLARFLDAIEFDDFTQSFANVSGGGSFRELRTSFSNVMRKFQGARSEKEAQLLYLRRVVQHVETGLIAFQPDGTITLLNDAALRLLYPAVEHPSRLPVPPTHLRMLPELLAAQLHSMPMDERVLFRFVHGDETLHLLLHATRFMLREKLYTLVSLHNIRSELDRQELDAWQKLARVLTHEIMNSITPIASLASTTSNLFSTYRGEPDLAGSITSALHTIEKRSNGLLRFVDSYRKLLRIPAPVVQVVRAREIFERVRNLVQAVMEEKGIRFTVVCEPEETVLNADPALLEQALINLVLNAIDAVAGREQPDIQLTIRQSGYERVILTVQDNGVGMNTEVQEKIFVPFFTTRRNGSGVGLSITRQIVHAHGGTIAVLSVPDEGTTFTIRL